MLKQLVIYEPYLMGGVHATLQTLSYIYPDLREARPCAIRSPC